MKLIFIMFTMIPPYLFLLSNLLRQPTIDSLLTICFWHKSAFTSIGGGVVQVENSSTFTSAIQLLPSYIPKISDWASNRRYFQQRAQLMESSLFVLFDPKVLGSLGYRCLETWKWYAFRFCLLTDIWKWLVLLWCVLTITIVSVIIYSRILLLGTRPEKLKLSIWALSHWTHWISLF